MLIYTVALFTLAALIGLYMAAKVFGNALPPVAAPILHGLFAATGLVLLLYVTFLSGAPQRLSIAVSAMLLLLAALGGFVAVSFHLSRKVPPKALVAAHGLLAVAGFISLAGGTFGYF